MERNIYAWWSLPYWSSVWLYAQRWLYGGLPAHCSIEILKSCRFWTQKHLWWHWLTGSCSCILSLLPIYWHLELQILCSTCQQTVQMWSICWSKRFLFWSPGACLHFWCREHVVNVTVSIVSATFHAVNWSSRVSFLLWVYALILKITDDWDEKIVNPEPLWKYVWLVVFTKSSQKISTHLLTVLTYGAIT